MSNIGNKILVDSGESGMDTSGLTKPARKPLLRGVALLEIAVFLGLALLVDQLFFNGTRFSELEPHPFWAIVVLLSVQYGSRMGLLAAFASAAAFLLGNLPPRLLEQDMHQWFLLTFKLPILWSITAVAVGELSARHIGARLRLNKELAECLQREATLSGSFRKLNAIKERMEVRMAGQWRTVSKTLKTARMLEEQAASEVLVRSLDLVADLLGPDKFSIYLKNSNALNLCCEKGWQQDDTFVRSFTSSHPLFTHIVGQRQQLYICKEHDEGVLMGQGVLAGPIVLPETGELLGMLKIEKMAFSQLSINSVRDFEFLCDWIASVYSKALEREQSKQVCLGRPAETISADDMPYFSKRFGVNLTQIKILLTDYDILSKEMHARFLQILKQSINDALRRTDVVLNAEERYGEFALLLPGAGAQYVSLVTQRLSQSLDIKLAAMASQINYTLKSQTLGAISSSDASEMNTASASM